MPLPREVYSHHITINTGIDGETATTDGVEFDLLALDPAERATVKHSIALHNKMHDNLRLENTLIGVLVDKVGIKHTNNRLPESLREDH